MSLPKEILNITSEIFTINTFLEIIIVTQKYSQKNIHKKYYRNAKFPRIIFTKKNHNIIKKTFYGYTPKFQVFMKIRWTGNAYRR